MKRTNVLEGGWKLKPFVDSKFEQALISIIIGFAVFIIIYGITPLNVMNDKWILAGYDESDIIQHYSGWLAYRNSEWNFPLGLASKLASEDGTFISYTDSIPWVAIFFKLIKGVLPVTFQYFGIYALLCYILQSIAAYQIVLYKTGNTIFSYLASILFSFSPVLLERSLRHTGLGSQWLVLFSILIYMRHRDVKKRSDYVWYVILEVLAIGIHPYFLPMVAIFQFLCVIDDVVAKKIGSIIYMVGSLIITYFFGCILGVLGNNIEISRWGYGYFSMNLNAVLNPISRGGYNWSIFLKSHAQILGNYDGFNYLGLGIVLAGCGLIVSAFILGKQKIIWEYCKKYWTALVTCIALTAFAISNVVTFNDKTLFTVPLPEFLLNLCGIFRASSRMFYPVYYLIFILIVYAIYCFCRDKGNLQYMILSLVIVVQLLDLHICIVQKHTQMESKGSYISSVIENNDLMLIAQNVDTVILDNFNGDNGTLAVWAFKNNLSTLYSTANSGAYDDSCALSLKIIQGVKSGDDIERNVIVTTDYDTANQYMIIDGLFIYKCVDIYFICKDIGYSEFITQYNNDNTNSIMASDLTDDNWTGGILNADGQTILFPYSVSLLKEILDATYLKTGDAKVQIVGIDFDENWIRVVVDNTAWDFQYPANLSLGSEVAE